MYTLAAALSKLSTRQQPKHQKHTYVTLNLSARDTAYVTAYT